MNKSRVATALMLTGALFGTAACGGSSGTKTTSASSGSTGAAKSQTATGGGGGSKVLTFGAMFPLTGPAASIGKEQEQGAQLAVDQINKAGGIDGYTLKMVAVDHKGTAQGGAQGMNQLVNLDHVPYVLSGFASVLLAAQPIAAQNHVLLMNTGGAGTELLNKPWLYNVAPNPGLLDPPLADYAWNTLKARTVAMLYSDDAYGQENSAVFKQSWEKLGGKVVASATFPIGATDFTSQLTQIKNAHPDVLYTVTLGQTSGLIVKQARSLGISVPLMNPLLSPPYKVGGAAANGYLGTNGYVDTKTTDPQAQKFITGWENAYHSQPQFSDGEAYEGVQAFATLAKSVLDAKGNPNDGQALLNALQQKPEFHDFMAGGTIKLLPNHDDLQPIALQKSEGPNLVTIKVIPPPSQ